MERMSDLARRLEAPLHGSDARFTRVATDTRALAPGDLFVALKGERFDGHEFIEQARQAGPDDVVVVAGKGHEDYQLYGNERRSFSDRAFVRDLVGQR